MSTILDKKNYVSELFFYLRHFSAKDKPFPRTREGLNKRSSQMNKNK